MRSDRITIADAKSSAIEANETLASPHQRVKFFSKEDKTEYYYIDVPKHFFDSRNRIIRIPALATDGSIYTAAVIIEKLNPENDHNNARLKKILIFHSIFYRQMRQFFLDLLEKDKAILMQPSHSNALVFIQFYTQPITNDEIGLLQALCEEYKITFHGLDIHLPIKTRPTSFGGNEAQTDSAEKAIHIPIALEEKAESIEYINIDNYQIPLSNNLRNFIDCVSLDFMALPVFATDGRPYEATSIVNWYTNKQHSPLGREPLQDYFIFDLYLYNEIRQFFTAQLLKDQSRLANSTYQSALAIMQKRAQGVAQNDFGMAELQRICQAARVNIHGLDALPESSLSSINILPDIVASSNNQYNNNAPVPINTNSYPRPFRGAIILGTLISELSYHFFDASALLTRMEFNIGAPTLLGLSEGLFHLFRQRGDYNPSKIFRIFYAIIVANLSMAFVTLVPEKLPSWAPSLIILAAAFCYDNIHYAPPLARNIYSWFAPRPRASEAATIANVIDDDPYAGLGADLLVNEYNFPGVS